VRENELPQPGKEWPSKKPKRGGKEIIQWVYFTLFYAVVKSLEH